MNLTELQINTVNYICEYIVGYHSVPSTGDIARNFGISVNAAFDRLKTLKRKGIITSLPNGSYKLLKHKIKVERCEN